MPGDSPASDGEAAGGGVGLAGAADMGDRREERALHPARVIFGLFPALIAPFLERRVSLGKLRYLALQLDRARRERGAAHRLVDRIAEGEVKDRSSRAGAPSLSLLARRAGSREALVRRARGSASIARSNRRSSAPRRG